MSTLFLLSKVGFCVGMLGVSYQSMIAIYLNKTRVDIFQIEDGIQLSENLHKKEPGMNQDVYYQGKFRDMEEMKQILIEHKKIYNQLISKCIIPTTSGLIKYDLE